jgi:choline monooxygenase
MTDEITRFDPDLPVERAKTPPASWYRDAGILALEEERVFRTSWILAARSDQLTRPGAFVTGSVAGAPYVVVKDESGTLRAFFNVCRHHAALVKDGEGTCAELVCPYHGWTYALDGSLSRAPRMGKMEDFHREDFGLVPMEVAERPPFVFVCPGRPAWDLEGELGSLFSRLDETAIDGLQFVERREYTLACNWKVFSDNYLDGGYHVEVLHGALAGELDLGSYSTRTFGRYSLQTCRGGGDSERIGGEALYAYVYPNLMINRYGPVLDTNLVVPLGPERCRVIFDFWFAETRGAEAQAFVKESLDASHRVQLEDTMICESVQKGLHSGVYDTGRYAPALEHAMYEFHRLLSRDLRGASVLAAVGDRSSG